MKSSMSAVTEVCCVYLTEPHSHHVVYSLKNTDSPPYGPRFYPEPTDSEEPFDGKKVSSRVLSKITVSFNAHNLILAETGSTGV